VLAGFMILVPIRMQLIMMFPVQWRFLKCWIGGTKLKLEENWGATSTSEKNANRINNNRYSLIGMLSS